MYIVVGVGDSTEDEKYIAYWYIGLNSTRPLAEGEYRFKGIEVPSNLYADPHRWYIDPFGKLRKNPYKVLETTIEK